VERRKERVGQNEVLYREVNERIRELDRRFGSQTQELQQYVCECGRPDCVDPIRMTLDEYRRVREDATTFAIVRGHEDPTVEYVVETTDRFAVIRKRDGRP
jgi:hypothetical protein